MKMGGKAGVSPPLIIIVFALMLEDENSATTGSAAAVSRVFSSCFSLLNMDG
jgi:hypothetical protein